MNILIINFEYPPLGGGGGVATKDMAEELAKRHDVFVLTTAFQGSVLEERVNGVMIHRVRVLRRTSLPTSTILSLVTFAPAALFAGVRILRKIPFDVIYTQFVIPSGLPAMLLSRLFHIPFVLTFIGGDVYDPSKKISPHRFMFLRILVRWISRAASARTAISHDTKQRTIELHGVQDDILVIPIGLKMYKEQIASKQEFGYLENDIVCVSIGRLVERKGYDVLLAAWKEIPAAKLGIIGDGPLKAELSRTIHEYELTDRVRLFGKVSEEEKMRLLALADIYVSAAQHEGFGIVFLEAMQAGLPIVATNDGGQTDFLKEGEHALLTEPNDSHAIARAVGRLIENNEMRERMSRTNKEAVREYYLEHTVQRIERILLDHRKQYEHRD